MTIRCHSNTKTSYFSNKYKKKTHGESSDHRILKPHFGPQIKHKPDFQSDQRNLYKAIRLIWYHYLLFFSQTYQKQNDGTLFSVGINDTRHKQR